MARFILTNTYFDQCKEIFNVWLANQIRESITIISIFKQILLIFWKIYISLLIVTQSPNAQSIHYSWLI